MAFRFPGNTLGKIRRHWEPRFKTLRNRSLIAVIGIGVLTTICPAFGAEDLDTLKEEFRRLQEENSRLKQKLDAQAGAIKTLTDRMEVLEQKPRPATPQPAAEDDHGMEMGLDPAEGSPSLTLHWFGDVNYRAGGKIRGGEELPNSFSLGQLGLMANSKLSERVSVMSEIVFQYKDDESASTTIERLQLQYHANDLFNFRLGRTHTPFGYWNETFHHGTWFQSTALRPELLRFHDGGSVVPIHSVGVEMYGYQPTKLVDLHYNVGLANGRGLKYTDTVDVQDLNDHKAVYGVLSLQPAAVPGLRFGVNAYGDVIPPDAAVAGRNGEIDELIAGAHVTYLRDNFELLLEGMRIEHDDEAGNRRHTTWGAYAQVGYQLKRFKPYYRFDILDVGEGDPFYGPLVVDVRRHTFGIRWDFITWAALKLEYHHVDQDGLDNPHAFYTQATFTY
ncbi:MAG TPA: hypothetical protein DCY13_18690 [Verrucomicrobiales bacterium]|nr:hypothetical protein [Verrucomicrobiales bacterium]